MFAFLYPGQGSQQPGMGRFLYDEFPIAKQTFEEAADSINLNLKKLCFDGDVSELALTENTQPCLLTVSTATARVLETEFGCKPSVAMGHSIGEYGALVASSVMRFSDAVKAVRARGLAMQSAVPVGEGGMLAVLGLTDEQAQELCDWTMKHSHFSPLSPANFNSPGQVVISGNAKAIDWISNEFIAAKLWETNTPKFKGIRLQVSAPFHCSMMKPAEDEMRDLLTSMEFSTAKIPVIQNFTAKAEYDAKTIRENLIRQISAPVLWTQSVLNLKSMGTNKVIEVGVGKVLNGLLKKIDPEFFKVLNTNSVDDLKVIAKEIAP